MINFTLLMKKLVFLIFLSFITTELSAQETFVLKGVVFQKGTSNRIGKAEIRNLNKRLALYCDDFGVFNILASIGDSIVITKEGYSTFATKIKAKQNLVVYLNRFNVLAEVNIKEKTKQQEREEIIDDFRSKGSFYAGKPPLLAYIFNPLTALYELTGKGPNQARRFNNYMGREIAESEVDRRFSKAFINKTIDIPEKDLAAFMFMYRPKPSEMQQLNDYDLMTYIKKSYLKFKANGSGKLNK